MTEFKTKAKKDNREIDFERMQAAWIRYREAMSNSDMAFAEALEALNEFNRYWELYFQGRENAKLQ